MFFYEGYTALTIAGFVLLVVGLIVLNELSRRSKAMAAVLYGAVPLLLFILIAAKVVQSPSTKTWFGPLKTFSALMGVWGFLAIRFTKAGETRFRWIFPAAILGINIVEAIYRDFEVFAHYQTPHLDAAGLMLHGGYWNVFNALAGILLLATMTGWVGIKVSNTKEKDMVWPDQLWFWIIAYDLWNAAYCYNCIPKRGLYTGVVLLVACTVAEFALRRGVWLEHRAQTLALFGMFSLAFDYSAWPMFKIVATQRPAAWGVLSVAAFLFNLGVFVYMVATAVRTRRNPYTGELFTDLKAYKKNLAANKL